MKHAAGSLHSRPRMMSAVAIGIAAGVLVPHIDRAVTRVLIGWNVGVWLLLALIAWLMREADHERMRRAAIAQAESAPTVLAVIVVAAIVSIAAIIIELSGAKGPGGSHPLPRVLIALMTIASSWLLLPTLFAMNYASLYYAGSDGAGLQFPDTEPGFHPDYTDFLYFSFTIAVAAQTADVAISTNPMRRLVLLHAVLSFIFNTTILALAINIAASLF